MHNTHLMRKYFYLILFALSYLDIYAAPGDDCASSILVSSNGCSAAGAYNNTGVTGTLAPSSCFTGGNNNGMWFKFVASTRIVNVTVNGGTLTQPQLALMDPGTNGCSGPFTELACNSSATATAILNYSNLTIGNTYYIYVDGQNNGVGTFQLCLTSPIAPANDNPCNPIVVPASNFCSAPDAFTNIGAGSENLFSSTYPGCWTSTGAYNTVYFQFTAIGAYNTISVTGGSLSSPQIAIVTTANCNGSTWSNNGASNCASSNTNTVTMNANNLTPGQTYLIAVDGKVDNVGTFQLCVNSYVPTSGPPNDICANATPLCPNAFVSGTTQGATATNDIPIGLWNCNGVLDNPVWFKFVADTPVQPVVISLNGTCSADYLQVEVFRFTGSSNPCGNYSQYASIACDNSISSGSATLSIPAANMVAGQTYYILVDNWPGDYCNFSFTITGVAGANAGADQDVCISQAPFNLNGTPAGGAWSGTGITNTTLGTFNPQLAGYGTHTLFYTNGACSDQKIINVTGPQVVCSNDISICGGSAQLLGTITEMPPTVLKAFTNSTSTAIPDNNSTGISSVVTVSGINPLTVATNPIQKVCMNINHSYDGDLDIYLVCPGGTQIELTTDNGGSGDNFTNTCFVASGTAITAGSAPFTGNYTPEQPFTNLNACNVNGNWTLKVIDDAGGDVGTLLNWSIYFNSQNTISSFNWSPTTNMTGSATLSPTVTPTASTTYTLSATDVSGCVVSDTIRVNLGGSIAGPDQSICLNTSSTFASSGTGTWTAVPGNPAVVSIQSASNPVSNVGPFNTAGTYKFEWNTGSCRDTVTITVNTIPVANAGPDKTITCASPNTVIGTPGVAGINYTWSPPGGLSATNIAQPTASQAGTYTVTATNPTTTCFSTDQVVVTSSGTPPVANAGIDQTLTCTTTSIQLGTAAIAGNTYSWSPPAGLSSTSIAQPTATAPGTYTLTVTNTANGCTATDVVVISQNITPPTANAGIDATLTCTTTSTIIGSPGVAGNTYSWTPPAGLSSTSIAQPTATAPGTYTLTVTNTANGCTATDAVVISRNITPPVANAGTDKTLTCTVTSVQIGTAAVAGNTYAWTPPAGLSSTSIAQPTATAPGTYTLTVTNTANGCTATDAVVVTQGTLPPIADAGTDQTLTCTQTSIQIGSPVVAGITYSWSPPAGLSSTTIAQPTASLPGTYTVTATNPGNGCSSTDIVVVSQNTTPPVANAGPDKTLTCALTSVQIGTAAVVGNTYSWTPPTGLSGTTLAQPNATAPGTFTVTVTNTANGCTSSDAVVISFIGTLPPVNAGSDKTLTCSQTSVQIGSPAVPGITYSWSPPTGLSTPSVAQPSASAPGTYTVTATDPSTGCSASDIVVISQDITPPVANAGTDKTLTCTVTSVQIGTAAVAGNTYAWTPPGGLSITNIAQPTATAPGTYTVTVTNTANGCTASDAVLVSQNTTPPVANAGTDQTLTCTITSVPIGSPAIAGNTYSWTPPGGISSTSIAEPTATAPGTYTITVTNTSNGCKATDAVVISQNITPPVANAGADQTLTCVTSSVILGAPAVAGNSYTWTPPGNLSSSSIAQPSTGSPGTYTLTVTNTSNGCKASDAVIISKNITPPVANAGTDKILTCATTSALLGTAGIAGNTYAWSPGGGLSSSSTAQPSANLPDIYTLTVTNTANGCTSTDQVTVTADTIHPVADAGPDKTLTCTIKSQTIGSAPVTGINYSWTPAIGLNTPNIAQPIADLPATYVVTATNPVNGCSATDDMTVTSNTPYTAIDLGSDVTIYQEESVELSAAGSPVGNYVWTPAGTLSCVDCAKPVASPLTTSTYFLTFTNPDTCITLDTITVNVIPVIGLFFPNAFSPNMDGFNDYFAALGDSVKSYELNIYNRWGELVFSTKDINAGWDGVYKGEPQPQDSYVYTAHAILYNNKKKDYKGIVTLVR